MSKYDYNLIVIGGGSAGLVSSLIAARAGAKVALVEEQRMGGDCLYTGCVPSKTLIASAKAAHAVRDASRFGIDASEPKIDFERVMARVQEVIASIEPHDSPERYEGLGVNCIHGHASLLSPHHVEVDDKVLSTRGIVLASGSRPSVPPIEGLDESPFLTSDTVWQLQELPHRLTVLGGGAVGCELAQAFARLGSSVTIVERESHLLPIEDTDTSTQIETAFQEESISVLTHSLARRVDQSSIQVESKDQTVVVAHDTLLVAVGRKAETEYIHPTSNNIELNENGTVAVNDYLQTSIRNIYGCGDVVGPYQFTHTAGHQAWYATINSMARPFYRMKYPSSAIPVAVFTDPEVARVGLTEREARNQFDDVLVARQPLATNDRSRAEGLSQGMVKVITRGTNDKILGATIIAPNAGDLIQNFVSAMSRGDGLKSFSTLIFPYPTISESIGQVARNWRQKELSPRLMSISRHFLEILR